MKKLLIIITLFVSSFFFIFLKEAKASISWLFNDYSLVNTDTFSLIKHKAEELKKTLDYKNYIISYNSSSYYVIYFNDDSLSFVSAYSSGYTYAIKISSFDYYKYDESISDFVLSNSYTSSTNYTLNNNKYLLYSTVDIYFKYSSSVGYLNYRSPDFSNNYNDSSYDGIAIPLLYNICLENGVCVVQDENPHKEEIEIVESFYKVVIEKLSYLAEQIVSNYIYLSIIVIFILIFVFLLIFRRHL